MQQRSQFHSKVHHTWLQKRSKQTAKFEYLKYPDEQELQSNLFKIFKTFDDDGSNSLDYQEMVKMFNHFGFDISQNNISQLFHKVFQNQTKALDFEKFFSCVTNPKIDQRYNYLITEKLSKQDYVYLPRSFAAMMSYLSFQVNREAILQNANNEEFSYPERFNSFIELLKMQKLNLAKEQNENQENLSSLQQSIQGESINQTCNEETQDLQKESSRIVKSKRKESISTLPGLGPRAYENTIQKEKAEKHLKRRNIIDSSIITKENFGDEINLTLPRNTSCPHLEKEKDFYSNIKLKNFDIGYLKKKGKHRQIFSHIKLAPLIKKNGEFEITGKKVSHIPGFLLKYF